MEWYKKSMMKIKVSDSYLSLEGGLVLQHVDQVGVVDLKQHAGDFA